MLLACLSIVALLQPSPRLERLDNGLSVAIVEDHTLPLVSVQLWYRVGSAYDALGSPGLCHITRTILEHRDDAALRLRAAGVRFESRTLCDASYFASVLPPNFLDYVLAIEAQRMPPLLTTPDMLATGLSAAARDYGLTPNDPEKLAERRMLAALFPDHPYQHPPGFVAERLQNLEPDDVDEFLERWFVPGNATLLIVGDVSDVATMELVRQHFGKLPWAEPPRRVDYASPPAERIDAVGVSEVRAGVDLAWLTPPAGYFENAAIDVLMHRLCNPVDGSLSQRLAERGCFPPRWRREAWREHGLLTISVDLRHEESEPEAPAREIARIVRDALAETAEKVPDEIAFNRARTLAARDVLNGHAAFSDRALRLGWHEVIAGDLLLTAYEKPRVERLAVGDVQEAARELLEARAVVLVSRAEPTEQPDAQPAPPPPLKAEYPIQLDSGAVLDLLAKHATDVPPLKSPKSPATITTHELDNGVKITVCRIPGLQPVEVRTLAQPDYGIFTGAQATMAAGSTRHSVQQIRDYLSYHGLDIYPTLGEERSGLTSHGPATHVAQMIELHAELLRHPNRDPDAIKRAVTRGLVLRKWLVQTDHDEVYQYYLPSDLIGWTVGLRPETDAQRLGEHLAGLDELHDVGLLVVGDVEPQSAMAAATPVWSDWTANAAARAREARPKSRRSPTTDTFSTSTAWVEGDDAPPALYIGDHLWPPDLEPAAREWTDRLTRRLLGAAQWSDPQSFWPPTLDATRAWRWMCVPLRFPDLVSIHARGPTDRVISAFEQCLARLEQVQRGTTPPGQVATALRLTRVDQLLARDSSRSIADVLAREIHQPWLLPDALNSTQASVLISRNYRPRMRCVMVRGPDDLSAELRRFDNDPEESPPSPDSPPP